MLPEIIRYRIGAERADAFIEAYHKAGESLTASPHCSGYELLRSKKDPELFLLALRNVAEAQGGVAQLAEKTKLNRESLYKMLSERGNPELRSLDVLLHALGFRLAVSATR